MIFTKSERKWILETVKYDVINSSYRVLRESGIPIQNLKINLKDERGLFENYFRGLSLREAEGVSFIKKIFKEIASIVKDLIKIAAGVGIGYSVFSVAKAALVKTTQSFDLQASEPEVSVDAASASSTAAATEMAKEIVPSGEIAPIQKVIGSITTLIDKGAYLCKNILMKLGVSETVATTAAPYALAALSVAGMLIFIKLFKLIIAGIKKLFASWKANGKKKPANANDEAKKMASTSIKMQEQAASKIKHQPTKKKVQKKLNEKKRRLAAA